MISPAEETNRTLFLKALHKDPVQCPQPNCGGPVGVQDCSQLQDRVKTFELKCERCGWKERVMGREELVPPWDETVLMDMAYDHLMHQPAMCPHDGSPVIFTNVRVANGGGMTMIDKLAKEGRIVSHGILFDVNKSVVKPESMGTVHIGRVKLKPGKPFTFATLSSRAFRPS